MGFKWMCETFKWLCNILEGGAKSLKGAVLKAKSGTLTRTTIVLKLVDMIKDIGFFTQIRLGSV